MAFFCSVYFHTGCRQGSLTIGHKRRMAEQLKEELLPDDAIEQLTVTLDQLSFFFRIRLFTTGTSQSDNVVS